MIDKANTFIKPSPIHGLGLFAKKHIKRGDMINQGVAEFNEHIGEWIAYNNKWKIKSFTFNNGYCMINHSENSNTKRGKNDMAVASRNINSGEEITENYYALPDNQSPFKGVDLEKMIYNCKNEQYDKTP